MARFVFKLQSYQNLKVKLEDQKKLEYGQALAKLEKEKNYKKQLEDEKYKSIMAFKKSILEKINSFEFERYNDYILLLKNKIIEQEKIVVIAERFAESKRIELVEAVKQRKALDKLKENAHEEYVKEEKISEQKITDEIVSYQYNDK